MKHKFAVFSILLLAAILGSQGFAGIQISVNIAPPPIAVFDQPPAPGDGYIWTPGYYQYGDYGYYWVPGHWVIPPSEGVLWTPGYWANERGRYLWHEGYWGATVGFYGGVNYGNGYFGAGFTGGRWEGREFRHNTVVSNVDRDRVHNTYEDRSAMHEMKGPNHAFVGKGGSQARPSPQEQEAARAPHQPPTQAQRSHAEDAHNSHMAAHGGGRR